MALGNRRRLLALWALILLLALVVRLAFVLAVPQPDNAIGDSAEFDLLARNLLAGRGLSYGEPWEPSARRTPLYPLLLAGETALAGSPQGSQALSHLSLLLLQALLDVGTVALTGWLAWQAWRSPWAGLVAGLGWALYLPGAQLAGRVLADALFTFLMVAGVSLFVAGCVRLIEVAGEPGQRSPWRSPLILALGSGGLLGLAALARPTGLAIPGLLVIVLLASFYLVHWRIRSQAIDHGQAGPVAIEAGRAGAEGLEVSSIDHRIGTIGVLPPAKTVWAMVALLLTSAGLVLLPWFVRNYAAFDRVVAGSTLLGFNFYQTHYRLDQPDYAQLPGVWATLEAVRVDLQASGIDPGQLNEAELYDLALQRGLDMVRRYPQRFLRLTGLRLAQLWFNLGFTAQPSLGTWLFALGNALLLLLAVIAQVAQVWRYRRARLTRDSQAGPGRWGFVSLFSVPFLVQAFAVAILLYFTVSHAVVIAAGRYIIPALPFLLVLAAGVLPASGWLSGRQVLLEQSP